MDCNGHLDLHLSSRPGRPTIGGASGFELRRETLVKLLHGKVAPASRPRSIGKLMFLDSMGTIYAGKTELNCTKDSIQLSRSVYWQEPFSDVHCNVSKG